VGSLTLWSAFIEDASEGESSVYRFCDAGVVDRNSSFVVLISGMLPAINGCEADPIAALEVQ